MRARPLSAALALVIGLGCHKIEPVREAGAQSPDSPLPSPVPAPAAAPAPVAPQALTAGDPLIDLPVKGHLPAMAVIPVGATSRRPVAVVTHGNWGGPQWDCPLWRGILGADTFILCPRGVPRPDQPPPDSPSETAYTYDSAEALSAEIDEGITALRERFGDFMEEGPVLYAGCSRGAFLGAKIGASEPAKFSRLALLEGGHDPWTPANVKRFAEGGGERVLFTCGQYACLEAARVKARALKAAGVEARVAYAPYSGHVCHARVADETRRALPWLMSGDESHRPTP